MALSLEEAAAYAGISAERHWSQFAAFCRYELAAGGPDPHMRYVSWINRGETEIERAWRAGVYAVGVYNVATAEAIWQHWPAGAAASNPAGLTRWIDDNWAGLKLRRERRAIRTRAKLAMTLIRYRAWVNRMFTIRGQLDPDPRHAYRQIWAEMDQIPGAGRYAMFKLIETLRRSIGLEVDLPDLRPAGGWSPRLTLAALMPAVCSVEEAYVDRPGALAQSEFVAERARGNLHELTGLGVDRYRFEVFLCDYRQSAEGRRQYPGRSNDSELSYAAAVEAYFGPRVQLALPAARAALTPDWARGELNGWAGVRDELGPVLAEHGYTWSDALYEYAPGLDVSTPALRSGVRDVSALAEQTLSAAP